MKATRLIVSAVLFWVGMAPHIPASVIIPLPPAAALQASDAVFRGTVVGSTVYQNAAGLIFTRTSLRVDEAFKGKFPAILAVVERGGNLNGLDDFCGLSPQFQMGGEYLLFVQRGPDGALHCTQGSASALLLQPAAGGPHPRLATSSYLATVQTWLDAMRSLISRSPAAGADETDQAGTSGNLLPAALTGMLGGAATRYLQPDRGEPIPYYLDVDSLPAGITLAQATNAVLQALDAWTAVTSLKFQFAGFQSYGQAADTVTNRDGALHLQLHDNYNSINTAGVLGVGGRFATTSVLAGAGWGAGGNVAGNEFGKSFYGYVVLEATNSAMSVLSTFTEVLTHEIGHALNLAHSSENSAESDPYLRQAIMFYQAHGDGRGATLGDYDIATIRQIYPLDTPPFGYDRVMDITTSPNALPDLPGINQVELRGYDLQDAPVSLAVTNESTGTSGSFALAGTTLKFTPAAYYNTARLDPAGGTYYKAIYARYSDGTNASPYAVIRVISFNSDSGPGASDGLPDNWMIPYFGNANPAVGTHHGANDDADGDGLSNLQEYIAGSNPTNAANGLRLTAITPTNLQWQAKAYEVYEVQATTNFSAWTRLGNLVPTNAPIAVRTNILGPNITASYPLPGTSAPKQFYRVVKVP
ncbi:MAG TPA: matrixin family metalloprotease [Dongiaceae bacterium]|nr:matrixin family metalloprotease [Dongiaceae bacterium]